MKQAPQRYQIVDFFKRATILITAAGSMAGALGKTLKLLKELKEAVF